MGLHASISIDSVVNGDEFIACGGLDLYFINRRSVQPRHGTNKAANPTIGCS
jgi:hypothetical protein